MADGIDDELRRAMSAVEEVDRTAAREPRPRECRSLILGVMPLRSFLVGVVVLTLAACSAGDDAGDRQPDRQASPCANKRETFRADVDGDGTRDVVWRGHVRRRGLDELLVGVCTAETSSSVPVGGMGEGEFRAIDIDRDGRSEILTGGTTVSQMISEIVVLHSGRLVSVADLNLSSGPAQFAEINGASVPSVMEDWGCEDFDGDGTRDLVLVSATRQTAGAALHFEGYRIVGVNAHEVGARDQALDHMPDFNERLLPSC